MIKTSEDVSKTLYKDALYARDHPSRLRGIPTGFAGVDWRTRGIKQGELALLGASPGMGKSAVAGQFVLNIANWVRDNRPDEVVRVIHCEMSAEQFQQRLACHMAQVSSRKIETGTAGEEALKAYKNALYRLAELPIEIEDEPTSLADTVAFIRGRGEQPKKCAWWMVDYLQIHPVGDNFQGDTNNQTVESVKLFAKAAKHIAPGMVLSQLTKEVDSREDHRPVMNDLYGGRLVSASASVVMLLYRPDYYREKPEEERNEPQECKLIIDKNRNGAVGTVKMVFNPKFAEFKDTSNFGGDDGG